MKQIKDLFKDDKPREKLILKGAKALKNRELLALMLGSGQKGTPVLTIAKNLETLFEKEKLGALNLAKLSSIQGIGFSKACLIIAAFEFAKRFYVENERPQILSSDDVVPLLREYASKQQEYFITITLDGSKHLINSHVSFIGTLNQSIIHPREIFATAFIDRADSILIAHNHPSGNLEPSREDILITRKIKMVGEIVGIELIDHIIFFKKEHYSFAGNGNF